MNLQLFTVVFPPARDMLYFPPKNRNRLAILVFGKKSRLTHTNRGDTGQRGQSVSNSGGDR
jgi:hypothetical protein